MWGGLKLDYANGRSSVNGTPPAISVRVSRCRLRRRRSQISRVNSFAGRLCERLSTYWLPVCRNGQLFIGIMKSISLSKLSNLQGSRKDVHPAGGRKNERWPLRPQPLTKTYSVRRSWENFDAAAASIISKSLLLSRPS